MMRGIRWLPVGAAMAVVALSAPAAGAQEKAADRERPGSGGERRPARHPGRDRRDGRGRQRLRRGDRRRERARRGRALQLRHRRRRLHGVPRRRDGRDHDDRLAREVAGRDGAEQFFIDGKAPTDAQFNINRYSGLSAGVPGTPYAWCTPAQATAPTGSRTRSPTAPRSRGDGFTVDQTFFDQTDAERPVLRRHPVDGGDLPRRRRHAEGRRHDDPQPGHGQDLRALGRLGVSKGFYRGASPTRS